MTPDRFNQLKAQLDKKKQERDRLDGALRQKKKDLEDKYRVKSVKAARDVLDKWEQELEELENELEAELNSIEYSLKEPGRLDS